MLWGKDKDFTFPSCRSLILVNKIKILISKDALCSPQRGSGSHREFLIRSLSQIFCATFQGGLVGERRGSVEGKLSQTPSAVCKGWMCIGGPSFSVLEAGWGLSWQAAMHRCRGRCQFHLLLCPVSSRAAAERMVSWNILWAQYLSCGPPVQPPFVWNIRPSFLFSYSCSLHLSFVFQKYCRWGIWHFGARSSCYSKKITWH